MIPDFANTILHQLGGRRFTTMTGARSYTYNTADRSLSMQLPRRLTKQKITHLKITLAPSDTYTITALSITARTAVEQCEQARTPVALRQDIYADQLARVFTDVTGLDTRL